MSLIPSYFNLFDYFLGDERLASIGARTAIEFRGSHITYLELRLEVDYWTEHLLAAGVEEGDRVALLLYDSPEFIATMLATVSVGAIGVPINTFLSPDEVMFILSDSGARLVIAEEELEWKINLSEGRVSEHCSALIIDTAQRQFLEPKDDVAPRPSFPATTRDTPAILLYTSGSTGAPKGVLHRHGSVEYTVDTYARSVLQLSAVDRLYSASRLFFAYGLGNSFSFPLGSGATVLLDTARPTAEYLATLFEEQSPTVFFGVPAVYRGLLESHTTGRRLDTSSLRLCVSAAEALPGRIFEDWERAFGLEIIDGIGSTEMLHIFISNRQGSARAGSSGSVVEGYSARLIDDSGLEVEPEQLGHLWVRGGSATAGYWKREELTRETIHDGWVKTGDIYRCDAEGFFYHVGRSDDCFKVRGLWVSPIEVESALILHPAVVEAAVVAVTDNDGLATAKAYVVIRHQGGSKDLKQELREFVGSSLPQHKVPSQIEFIKEMPRTSTGKVQRYKLRAESQSSRSGE
ncbi:MAG TPA: benzoate-CoA ligase family protein [Blastocatellia bacterium]|nr:benzoate-CoA ligase family protein [Blastocatellia bacterium]